MEVSPLLTSRSPSLDSASHTGNYAIMTWLIQFQPSNPDLVFFGLHTNEANSIAVSWKNTDTYRILVFDYFGRSYELQIEGKVAHWMHLAIGVCGETAPFSFTVCSTKWQGLESDCSSLFLPTQPVSYSPDFSYFILGSSSPGPFTGLFIDIRLYTDICIGPTLIFSLLIPFFCAPECNMECIGPGFYHCTRFSMLFRPDFSYFAQNSVVSIDLEGDLAPVRELNGANVWFLGWFRMIVSAFSRLNVYKLENNRCDWPSNPGDGCQVLGVYYESGEYIVQVEGGNGVVESDRVADVRGMQPVAVGEWVYVTAGLCSDSDTAVMCVAGWGSASLTCVTVSVPSGILTFTGDIVYLGDPDYPGIYGNMRNVRVYSGTCYDSVTASAYYSSIKDYCVPGCAHCTALDICDQCDYGYYVDSDGVCERCHSCCKGCTGMGYYNCLECDEACTLIDTNTCARKRDR